MDHRVIRYAYENALTSAARLAAFAGESPIGSRGNLIDERQEILASNDLVSFAINARRLMEATETVRRFNTVSIVIKSGNKRSDASLKFIIGKIIHHKSLTILRTSHHLDIIRRIPLEKILKTENQVFSPLVFLQSDQGDAVNFKLSDLIILFETRILEPIVELCAEFNLFLDEEMFR